MTVHLDLAGFDALSGAEHRAAVDHLRACPACRQAAAEHDPTILFALLRETPVPVALLNEVSSGVRREVAALRAPGGVRRLAAAAMLALALLCGWAAGRAPAPPAVVTVARFPQDVVPRAAVDVNPAQAVSGVVDFTVGETQVVLVYNGDLHL